MDTTALLHLCRGNRDAVSFIENYWRFCCVWDDAIDRDKTSDPAAVHTAMLWALLGVQDNPVYRANETVLRAAILQSVASWMTANTFERSKKADLVEQAYFLRCAPYDVFSTVVLLVAGFDAQREAVQYFRSLAPEDTLAAYQQEHQGE